MNYQRERGAHGLKHTGKVLFKRCRWDTSEQGWQSKQPGNAQAGSVKQDKTQEKWTRGLVTNQTWWSSTKTLSLKPLASVSTAKNPEPCIYFIHNWQQHQHHLWHMIRSLNKWMHYTQNSVHLLQHSCSHITLSSGSSTGSLSHSGFNLKFCSHKKLSVTSITTLPPAASTLLKPTFFSHLLRPNSAQQRLLHSTSLWNSLPKHIRVYTHLSKTLTEAYLFKTDVWHMLSFNVL